MILKFLGAISNSNIYNTVLQKQNQNKQLMSMIDCYVFLAAESHSDIRFPPSRLDFAAHEVTIFRKQ